MKLIKRFVLLLATSSIALYLATSYIEGVSIPLTLNGFGLAVLVLALISLFIKPLIRLALTPIIILTLGLGIILVNAITLYLLDLALPAVTINGLLPLLLTAILLSVINLLISWVGKLI